MDDNKIPFRSDATFRSEDMAKKRCPGFSRKGVIEQKGILRDLRTSHLETWSRYIRISR